MRIPVIGSIRVVFIALLASFGVAYSQHPANSNSIYQLLRNLRPGDEVISIHNLEIKRDAAVFTFVQGNFAFYPPVNGKITGAIFRGQGHLHITPPTPQERRNYALTAHNEECDVDFTQVDLRFTDATADELRKAAVGKGEPDPGFAKDAKDLQDYARHNLHDNIDLRLLQDDLSPNPGGFFFAALYGTGSSHLFFLIDPNGWPGLQPEEVALMKYDSVSDNFAYPLAFHLASEYAAGTASGKQENAGYSILHEKLDVTIEKSGFLSSVATVEFRADKDGLAVLPLDIYPTLRVSNVQSATGQALDYVQEKKDEDPDFGVILPAPLKMGETSTIAITYGGKDVVINYENGNYDPVARSNWYPSSLQGIGGNYSTYDMSFHVPKGLQLIATGTKKSEHTDGSVTTSEWTTETPLALVGFSLGDFSTKQTVVGKDKQQLTVAAYANNGKPNFLQAINDDMLGTLATTPLLASELSQGSVAVQIYTDFFGPIPFSHIALTQQSACNYGQSWPMLVYLPICGFFDATQQHFLGIGGENLDKQMYWKVVTPHEVAHQWWGSTVGFGSYRDQWMSEGFADESASIFLQLTNSKPDQYLNFWKEERRMLTEKNQFGFRPIDVGPVTMGFRLSSPKAGWGVYGNLVYPKGAFILHMIRMMMWTPKDGDGRFKAAMHEFVTNYTMRPATTEDFKAAMEKYMTQSMDLDHNHRLDWFFNEYVYGTALPTYQFESNSTPAGDGTAMHVKITQSGVTQDFKMPVPIYIQTDDGKVFAIGSVSMAGNMTFDQVINLPKFSSPVKKALINYNYDVLSVDK